MKESVLIVCNSDLSREPRVLRQIIALKNNYQIFTLGQKSSGIKGVEHFDLNLEGDVSKHLSYPWLIRKIYSAGIKLYDKFKALYINYYFENDYWSDSRKKLVSKFITKKFDLIIVHHWDTLPIAVALQNNSSTKLIFNAHDYYEREFEKNELWAKYVQKLVTYAMSKYVPKFDLIFAAWTKIKEDYSKQYGVPSIIIDNATEYNDLQPVFKTSDDEKIRIIHHGIANSDRQIEKMIEVMNYLDSNKYSLDLMLVYNDHENSYFNSLKELASKNKNIRFVDPVPTREISKSINQYDIGLFLLPLNGFNPTYTLPNKLFEFVQGRLASLVTPNIEMKRVVEQYDLGWVTEDFEPRTAAEKIKNITKEELNQKKANAHKWAYELSAEKNYDLIRKSVSELLDRKSEVNIFNDKKKPELA